METKMITIPFDVELAKKIQAGEYPGEIVTRDGMDVRVLCFDAKRGLPIVCLATPDGQHESLQSCGRDGYFYGNGQKSRNDLILQIPEWTQFKDGDIIACEVDNGGGDYCKWYAVLDGSIGFMLGHTYFSSYVSYDYDSAYKAGQLTYNESCDNIDSIRLITEEEKQKFIDRLKEENTDQAKDSLKQFFGIEKVEEKPECEFEFLQPVLVKGNSSKSSWKYGLFTHIVHGKAGTWYHVGGGNCYLKCIPYNEKTKHLVGTTDNWEEE